MGPGVTYVRTPQDNSARHGRITNFITEGVDTASKLRTTSLDPQLFPYTFPGDGTLPLSSATVRLLEGGAALAVADYRVKTGGGNEQSTAIKLVISPAYRADTDYFLPQGNNVTANNAHEDGAVGADGRLAGKPVRIAQAVMSWSKTTFNNTAPDAHFPLWGKINNNSYTIDGYSVAANETRFEGVKITHVYSGGVHKWYSRVMVTFDSRFWKRGALGPKNTSFPFGEPDQRNIYDSSQYKIFPTEIFI